jgi:hypothetical protein
VFDFLFFLSCFGSFFFDNLSSLGFSITFKFLPELGSFGGVWVQPIHDGFVFQWVFLGFIMYTN